MENRSYTCQYCKKEYVPKRRGIQKFCSDSCRVSNHRLKKVSSTTKSIVVQQKEQEETSSIKVGQISTAGVANAAIGIGLVEVGKNLFTREENKPATKGDISKLAANLKRYHIIKNLPPNLQGQTPHFDIEKGEVVYIHTIFSL